MLSVVTDDTSTRSGSLIDEIVREGARRMLASALEAEVNQYIAELAAETDEYGRRLVVRNGHHRPRTVVTAAGQLVIGDGVMGLWRALAEVFPAARPQRCWVRKARDVANCLPKSAQPGGLAFYDFPAEHWIHLRTTDPIESAFSTVRLRTNVTRGACGPAAALAMVCKPVESAQARWRAITGAHLVSLVRARARFENGVLVEREEQVA
ncbi:transposase [Streptomyces sp. NPDC012508]|uniref:transposase n=1 Tax=Streptomyces sp. NPDC012508 TaxID=3364837 RepID=UPI0036A83CF3